ncbi:hypothetical protein ACRVX5_11685 [Clostridioides difficile]|uniref:hypothetical protein n=1 Tax=Clostridioides difficile TaxID=1496 RepID=UPI000D1F7B63|nr:hypothetical protein [Clostridioides difficile]MBY2508818.1 hypothetical protein [Clostridioides difficile]MCM4101044.1 hypothetical protein [Clostridioides difficile]MDM9773590.1 hypothetical protein [Clostridioides difficile]HBF7477285.1 hypothetical protein [Clostridioides difficile]HBG2116809.1 hypothetical protein [Clostridioides difficile]
MLSKTAKHRASEVASQLVNEGMVWGNDLECFIKSQVYRKKGFETDEDYLKFENMVLDFVEERIKKKNIEAVDTDTNIRIGIGNVNQLSKILKCNFATVNHFLKKDSLYKGKYKIRYVKLKLNEI